MDAPLEIFTLGGVRIVRAGMPVTGLATRKAEALLIYLASTRRPQPREALAELLWDERTQSQSMANLRGVLTNLRQVLGEHLSITRDTAGINPEADVWLDSLALEESLAAIRKQGELNPDSARQAGQALELYQGEFLQGFTVFDCRGFEDWSVRERERLHHLAVDGLSGLVDFAIREQEYQAGMAHAARLLELDPLMESAHRQMMLLLSSTGQRAAALSQYETCKKLLKAELGVEPDAETRQLYEHIRTGTPVAKETPDLLPTGTVTFLFCEAAGFSPQLRKECANLLSEHRRRLRETFASNGGHEVDAQGDALLVAFSRATQAVGAAGEAQEKLSELSWPEGTGVRMGLHTGEPWKASDEHASLNLHRAAHLAHAAHPRQVLLSEATAALVQDELPGGVSLPDLGRYLLKDSHRPEHIYQLALESLPMKFPPLVSVELLPPESARQPRRVGACPYRGLAAFQEADARFYFGRETFVEALEHAIATRKLVVVIVGSSGSGKSSALFAGLLPRLRKTGAYQVASLRPGTQPFYSLAGALIELLEPELSKTDLLAETRNLAERLSRREISLVEVLGCIHKDAKGKYKLLLVVDQFEELYTLCADAELQKAFIDELLATVEASQVGREGLAVILLTLRADFMGQALAHRPFADALQEASVLMGPMNRQELHTAIEKPAEMQGAAFEAGLVERILDDVGEKPGNLPLLQFTLTQLWERQTDGWLAHADYEAMGCVEGALASYADQVYGELDEAEQELARHALVQLVQPGEGTEDTRRIATRDELGAESWKLIQLLADKRLVVAGRDAQGRDSAEVVHEALIQKWGRFKEWMDADRAFRLWQERLRSSLKQWQESGKDEGALLAGAPLAVAQDWLSQRGGELNTAEIGYIQASQALQAKQQKERQRRRQWAFTGISIGMVVAVVLAVFAFYQRREAVAQRQEAETQRLVALKQASAGLAAQALAEMDGGQPERSVLLALEALEHYPYTPQAEAALASAVQETLPYRDVTLSGPYVESTGGGFDSIALSPDGKNIALGGFSLTADMNPLNIWEASTGVISEMPMTMRYHEGYPCRVYDMDWSPDSTRLAVITYNGFHADCNNFIVFDIKQRTILLSLVSQFEWDVDWSPDGKTLLSIGKDGSTRLWDAITGALLREFPGKPTLEAECSFSPDGTRIATAFDDGTFILRKISTGDVIKILESNQEYSRFETQYGDDYVANSFGLAWSPDGNRLATGTASGDVIVWDTASGEKMLEVRGHSEDIFHLEWSPSGRILASISIDYNMRLWDASTGKHILSSNKSGPFCFSTDGHHLVGSIGPVLRFWDLSVLPPIMPFPPIFFGLGEVMWSPDGKYLNNSGTIYDVNNDYQGLETATEWYTAWSPDSTRILGLYFGTDTSDPTAAIIRDARSGEVMAKLKTPPPFDSGFFTHGWSPDGSLVASMVYPNTQLVIWNPETGDELRRTPVYDGILMRPMFSPDSQLVAAGNIYIEGNSPLRLFDAHTGALVREIPSQDGNTVSPVWSPDGRYLAVTYSGGVVEIYDTTTWEAVRTFAAHSAEVWDVNWSPDGTRLVSGDYAGNAYVWDFATGEIVQRFSIGQEVITSVDWSPYGEYVAAVGGSFGTLVIRRAWQSTQELIDYAKECCAFRELTAEERAQFGLP